MAKKSNTINAWCFRNGVVFFSKKPAPDGALVIVSGDAKEVKKAVLLLARNSYPSKPGAGDEVPLVPGIPEAENEKQALDALLVFCEQVDRKLKGESPWDGPLTQKLVKRNKRRAKKGLPPR